MISSNFKLDNEIKFISMTLCNNGFPLNIVQTVIDNKITDFNKIKPESVQRRPVYLHLPWMVGGGVNDRFAKQISKAVQKNCFSINVCVVFNTKLILTSICKDFLPTITIVPHLFI